MDERTVTELMIDQLEFADVIVINKIDLVPKKRLQEIDGLCRKLNKDAKIFHTVHSKVDLKAILNTNSFNFEKAKENSHWLAQERYSHTPETIEYGITSFLYKVKRPFDNARLASTLSDNFLLDIDPTPIFDEANLPEGEEGQDAHHGHNHAHSHGSKADGQETANTLEGEADAMEEEEEEEPEEMSQAEKDKAKKIYQKQRTTAFTNKQKGVFKDVWRSKGFFWLASDSKNFFGWQQSGIINKVEIAGVFACALDEASRCAIPDYDKQVEEKFDPVIGDRETSLVFIGKYKLVFKVVNFN